MKEWQWSQGLTGRRGLEAWVTVVRGLEDSVSEARERGLPGGVKEMEGEGPSCN